MKISKIRILFRRIRSIKDFLLDPEESKGKKLLFAFGILYLISPVDLIPEPVFGIGIIDDLILWAVLLTSSGAALDRYWKDHSEDDSIRVSSKPGPVNAEKAFRGRKIVNTEGHVVDSEEEEPADSPE